MVKNSALTPSQFSRLAGVSAAAVTKALAGPLSPAKVGRRIDPDHPTALEYVERADARRTKKTPGGIDASYEDAVAYARTDPEWNPTRIQKHLGISWRRAKAISDMIHSTGVLSSTPTPPPPPPAIPKTKGQAKHQANKKGLTDADRDHELPENVQEFADWTLRDIVERFGTDVRFLDYLKAFKEIVNIHTAELKNAKTSGDLVNIELVQVGVIDPVNKMLEQVRSDGARTMSRRIPGMVKAGVEPHELEAYIVKTISSFIGPMKASIGRALDDAESIHNRD